MALQGSPIAPDISLEDRFQILANNLVLASAQKDITLCLRVIGSIMFWLPECTLDQIDQYCEKHQIPLVLIAHTVQTWNPDEVSCVSLENCFDPCPYVVYAAFIPRARKLAYYARMPMDMERPATTERTPEINDLYLQKCGVLLPHTHTQFPNQARQTDPVIAGTVRLSRAP